MAMGILEQIKAHQDITDEESLISVIQLALQEFTEDIQPTNAREENWQYKFI
jgi:hypothetical protein